jgi:uncharacterized membrane protein YeiH
VNLPVHIELAAIGVGAVSGAIHATRRGADLIGVLALAIAVGVGGGILRDVLLGAGPPLALTRPRYLEVVVVAAAISIFLGPLLARLERVIDLVDALLIGLWVIVGVERAIQQALPTGSAVFLGVVTATGGGLMRDVLVGERTALVAPGVLYVTPAICAAVAYLVGLHFTHPLGGEFLAISVATLLRAIALRRGWGLPTAEKIQSTLRESVLPRESRPSRHS